MIPHRKAMKDRQVSLKFAMLLSSSCKCHRLDSRMKNCFYVKFSLTLRRDGNVIAVSLWHLLRFTLRDNRRVFLSPIFNQKHIKRRRAKVARVSESAKTIVNRMKTEFNGAGWGWISWNKSSSSIPATLETKDIKYRNSNAAPGKKVLKISLRVVV